MAKVKFLGKKVIDQSQAREYDPTIQDSIMLTFEVKLIVKKDYYESTFNEDAILIGESDGRVSSWFYRLYTYLYKLRYRKAIT